jgi:hypothetical protein
VTARATVGRWRELARTGVAHALEAIDRRRAAAWRRGREGAPRRFDERAEAVLAVVAHWRPDAADAAETRVANLEQCLAGLLELQADSVVAVVLTNAPEATARDLSGRLPGSPPVRVAPPAAIDDAPAGFRGVLVVGWRPGFRHRNGYYLTWGHVPLLRRAARTNRFSHLVYLEDDMRFTGEHLAYWLRYRRPLAEAGLLPGFVRFEFRDGDRYLADALRPVDPALRRRTVCVTGEPAHVVNLENPYQALYVLDRELFEPHFRFSRGRSPLRSRLSEWEIRERAASGPIFDDVPDGLVSRNMVPVRLDGERQRLDPNCLVEHMGATYSTSTGPFGVLRVDELFVAPPGT